MGSQSFLILLTSKRKPSNQFEQDFAWFWVSKSENSVASFIRNINYFSILLSYLRCPKAMYLWHQNANPCIPFLLNINKNIIMEAWP